MTVTYNRFMLLLGAVSGGSLLAGHLMGHQVVNPNCHRSPVFWMAGGYIVAVFVGAEVVILLRRIGVLPKNRCYK